MIKLLLKSHTPVKTAAAIKNILDETGSGVKFEILSNPEFLAEGTAMRDLIVPDRVLIGGGQDKSGTQAIQSLVIFIHHGFLLKIS